MHRWLSALIMVCCSSSATAQDKIRFANGVDLWPAYLARACALGGPNTMLYGMSFFPYSFVSPSSGNPTFIDCVDGKLAPYVPKAPEK